MARQLFRACLVELFGMLNPKTFVDPMVGSGTSVQVAQEMGIDAIGLDLHSGVNALRQSIVETVGKESDLIVSHPPYGGMVIYSGEVWGNEPHPDDLSRCLSDEDFHQKLQVVLMNQREATKNGGFYGTIIGDWRRAGKYTSYQAEAIARMPSNELHGVLIKAQHNTLSAKKSYAGKPNLPLIMHEYILIWRKPDRVISFLESLATISREHRERSNATWRSVVYMALAAIGSPEAPLKDIYNYVAKNAPDKLSNNTKWREKIRQTLQLSPEFVSTQRGNWGLVKHSRAAA